MTASRGILALAAFLLASFAAAALGGLATARSVGDWYLALQKPTWTPPAGVFGPVWTTLYTLMAVAAWLVWRSGRGRAGPLALWSIQLGLNALWSILFFGLRRPGWAALEIVVLWVAIAATTAAFARRRTLAAGLMAPYLAWVTLAVALNVAIWRLN